MALARPFEAAWPNWARLAVMLALGLGVSGAALLASLRGRGQAEPLALYAFLILCADAFGQLLGPFGWPIWPVFMLLVGAVAVAETIGTALGVAAFTSLLTVAEAARRASPPGALPWRPASGTRPSRSPSIARSSARSVGSRKTVDELARLKYGIDQLDEDDASVSARGPGPP